MKNKIKFKKSEWQEIAMLLLSSKYIQCYTRIKTRKRSSAVIFQMACPPPPIFYNKKGLTNVQYYCSIWTKNRLTCTRPYIYIITFYIMFVPSYISIMSLFYFILLCILNSATCKKCGTLAQRAKNVAHYSANVLKMWLTIAQTC